MALFSIVTTLTCRAGHYSIPWIASLYPWSVPYNAKQVPFFVFSMTRPGIELVSLGPLAIACFNCWCLIRLDSNSSTDQWMVARQRGQSDASFFLSSMVIAAFFKVSLRQSLNNSMGLPGRHLPVEIFLWNSCFAIR